MVLLDNEGLSAKMKAVFLSHGLNTDSTNHAVDSMIQTSLRGVDSHGINLFPHYVRSVDSGRINKNPSFALNKTAVSSAILNADAAIGHHAGAVGMDHAISMAKETGMAAVNVMNSSHFGAAAYFGLRAAKQNCLGFAFTNADALVKAHNGKSSFFGTNPICFTAPLNDEEPFCLDMATSLISWNKVKNYRIKNQELETGWAYDKEGNPVTNPHDAASLRPAADYKGFGLGMMIDILCAVLVGGVMGKDMLPMFTSPAEAQRKVGHFFMAIDIEKFQDPTNFKNYLTSVVERIRAMEALENQRMMVAGDPEKIAFDYRKVNGIPMEDQVFEEYLKIDSLFESTVI